MHGGQTAENLSASEDDRDAVAVRAGVGATQSFYVFSGGAGQVLNDSMLKRCEKTSFLQNYRIYVKSTCEKCAWHVQYH